MMREYAKVSPLFWTGTTGKELRRLGRDVQVVAFYLITCPSASMLGLYYLPLPTLCHETGLSTQGALKALRRASEGGFGHYNAHFEHVWVPEMARFQVGEELQPSDNRIKGIIKELDAFRKSPFFNAFLDKYAARFHLENVAREPSPSEGPPKALRSQETETETETEQEQTPAAKPLRSCVSLAFAEFWTAYPRKLDKQDAVASWNKQALDALLPDILAALEAFKRSENWRRDGGRFIPHAATWLNRRQWEDEHPETGGIEPGSMDAAVEIRGNW